MLIHYYSGWNTITNDQSMSLRDILALCLKRPPSDCTWIVPGTMDCDGVPVAEKTVDHYDSNWLELIWA